MKRNLIAMATVLFLLACEKPHERARVSEATGGDPQHGRQLIQQYGCQSCHTIPGVEGPRGVVGPPLDRMAMRGYIAGKVTNTPQNMIRWIEDPQSIDPGNAMPALGVTPSDARDITAYLFTLR